MVSLVKTGMLCPLQHTSRRTKPWPCPQHTTTSYRSAYASTAVSPRETTSLVPLLANFSPPAGARTGRAGQRPSKGACGHKQGDMGAKRRDIRAKQRDIHAKQRDIRSSSQGWSTLPHLSYSCALTRAF
jgi:hypothetical protein